MKPHLATWEWKNCFPIVSLQGKAPARDSCLSPHLPAAPRESLLSIELCLGTICRHFPPSSPLLPHQMQLDVVLPVISTELLRHSEPHSGGAGASHPQEMSPSDSWLPPGSCPGRSFFE